MKKRSIVKLRNKATLILTLYLILLFAFFLLLGFLLLNNMLYKKDVTSLTRIMQGTQIVYNRQLNQVLERTTFLSEHYNLSAFFNTKSLLIKIKKDNPMLDGFFLVADSIPYGSNFSLDTNLINDLKKKAFSGEAHSSFIKDKEIIRIIGYVPLKNNEVIYGCLITVWKFTQVENIYPELVRDLNIRILPTPDRKKDIPPSVQEIIDQINTSDEQIYIENVNNELIAYSFIKDIYEQPIALKIIITERILKEQLLLSFWLIGIILVIISVLTASYLAKKFSDYLMIPVENLSYEMDDIARNPLEASSIEVSKYPALDILVSSFNGILTSFQNSSYAERKYQHLVDNLSEGVFWADSKGNLIISNFSFQAIFQEELTNTENNIFEIFNLEDNYLENLKKFPVGISEIELNDKYYLLLLNQMHIGNEDDFFGIISDITTQKHSEIARTAMEIKLAQSEKLASIGLLIEGICHNLNTPLNNILGYSQIIAESLPDNKILGKILDNGRKLAEIIKSLLNRAYDERVFAPREVNINDLVTKEIDFYQHNLFFKNKVEKVISLMEELPVFVCVYSDISQIISNLINNAIEALKDSENKKIFISTYLSQKYIVVEIKDTGRGISKDVLGKIFEPFYSSNNTDTTKVRGLGLSISKQLISTYKGEIKVESSPQGSCFSILLPI